LIAITVSYVILFCIIVVSFRYLLEAYEYNKDLKTVSPGGPLALTQNEIETLVGEWAAVDQLQSEPADQDFLSRYPEFIDQDCKLNIYFIHSLKLAKENADNFPGVSL